MTRRARPNRRRLRKEKEKKGDVRSIQRTFFKNDSRRELTCFVVLFRPSADVGLARSKLRCSEPRRRHQRTAGVGDCKRNDEAFVLLPHVERSFVACCEGGRVDKLAKVGRIEEKKEERGTRL